MYWYEKVDVIRRSGGVGFSQRQATNRVSPGSVSPARHWPFNAQAAVSKNSSAASSRS